MVKLVSSSMVLLLSLASTCMAQSTSASTKTAATPPAPTGAPRVGPAVLVVLAPENNTAVYQGQAFSIIATFGNKRLINTMTASISKPDGSGNQTVATSAIANMQRTFALWNITSDFPLGNYNINVQAQPMLVLPTIPGQAIPPVLPPMDPVYYWNGVISVQKALAPTSGSGGNGGGGSGSTSGAASSLSKISGAATSMVILALGTFLWM